MSWIALSILGAFFQALGAAMKKKTLQTPGMNNVIGFVAFIVAGLIFGLVYFLKTGELWYPDLSEKFWWGMMWYAGLNILAVWFMYRALDIAEFNYLMPFMTLTTLFVAIPPMFILGEIPTIASVFGMALIVFGVLYLNYQPNKNGQDKERRRKNFKGITYFIATAICYTIAPTYAKVTVTESSILFASFVVHILIGLGFLIMILLFRETGKLAGLLIDPELRKLFVAIFLAGVVIVLENGSINAALSESSVAYVFALKRLMPFFAFLLGYFYFKEKTDLKKKAIATALMVAGAVLITALG